MDHADIYGNHSSEQLFGDAMQLTPKSRDSLFIISKCGIKFPSEQTPQYKIKHYNYSEKAIIQSVEHSLQHLKTDYLDALLLHRPSPLMDINHIGSAINTLISSGKIKYAGVCNFTCQQFTLLNSKIELITNQIECSVLHSKALNDGTIDQLYQKDLRPMAWSPLGGNALFHPTTESQQALHSLLNDYVKKYQVEHIGQIALAWLLKHPARIIPVLGTQNVKHLITNIAAQDITLDIEDWFSILKVVTGHDVA